MKALGIFLVLSCAQLACAQDASAPELGRVFHRTMEEAIKAAGLQETMTKENDDFRDQVSAHYDKMVAGLGSAFAGTWMEYDSDGKAYLVVALTRPATLDASWIPDNRLKVVRFKHDYQSLKAIENRIVEKYLKTATFAPPIFEVFLDVRSNIVTVYTYPDQMENLRRMLRADGFDMNLLTIESRDGPVQPASPGRGAAPTLAAIHGGVMMGHG